MHQVYFNILGSNKVRGVGLSRLVKGELPWQFLSFQHQWEWVSSTVLVVDFSDIDGVISQVIMHDVRDVALDVELKYFPVVLQELFLRLNY